MRFRGKSTLSAAYVQSYVLAKGREVAYLIARYKPNEHQLRAHFSSINNGGEGIYKPTPKQEKIEEQRKQNHQMIDEVIIDDLGHGDGTVAEATITFAPYDPDLYATRKANNTPVAKLIEYAKTDPVAKKMIRQYKKEIDELLRPGHKIAIDFF